LYREVWEFWEDLNLDTISLQQKLLSWFASNRRLLPWRKSSDWYKIWISEVMLQQTQVEQVIPYYLRFIGKFKNVNHLAVAAEEEVLKVWEGLGYYSRARNLHRSAKIIVNRYKSCLPRNLDDLQKLPGFGPYTANAVLSIAFNQPYGVVDGNIKRVISRLFALSEDIRKPASHKKIQQLMDSLLPPGKSGPFNEAMMELGALVCQPAKPGCTECPLKMNCLAYQQGIEKEIPYRSKRKKIPTYESVAFIIRYGDEYLLVKRGPEGMLGGMWEFPTFRLQQGETIEKFEKSFFSRHQFNQNLQKKYWPPINHSYTHFKLILHSVLIIKKKKEFPLDGYLEYRWNSLNALKKLPLHKAIWKVLEQIEKDLISITN
jgi:A/G-specific adenine glycosylase